MWKELIDIFRGKDAPLEEVATEFRAMLELTREMSDLVRPHIFEGALPMDVRRRVYELDVEVNKLERSVRKRLITHLSLRPSHVPYSLLLISMSKDAERVGDYVKNIAEVGDLGGGTVPDGELRDELSDLISVADRLHREVAGVLDAQARERAIELVQLGRTAGKRCDRLVGAIATSDLPAAQVTALVLLTRFYKRLGAHLVNILSSVIMPVHKVDFFDESELGDGQRFD
ncbi:MAG: hypothetical protein RIT45_3614 [Pseudomonadota bacterium]